MVTDTKKIFLPPVQRIKDELNLYLVTHNLKPATLVTLSGFRNLLEVRDGVSYETLGVDSHIVDELKDYLDHLKMKYEARRETTHPHQSHYFHHFFVSSNCTDLKRLLFARNDREVGLALGFPVEAVDAFLRVINNERRDAAYFCVSLARAQQAGVEIPTWLAYLDYIPEDLDFVHGNVSPSSRRLGEKYQSFVKQTNQDLAKRVEQEFFRIELPDRLEDAGKWKL